MEFELLWLAGERKVNLSRVYRRCSMERFEQRCAMDATGVQLGAVGAEVVESDPAAAEWRNELIPTDVNQDGQITSLDALIVINETERIRLDPSYVPSLDHKVDVNGDGAVSPADALAVVNELHVPRRDTAVALSETLIARSNVEWEFASVRRLDDGDYIVYYDTPLNEVILLGHRATRVDMLSQSVQFIPQE